MLVLKVVWFLLPAGFANMAPIFAREIFSNWTTAIDGGLTLQGERVFGSHKTVRGFASGILTGTVIFFLQREMYERYSVVRDISMFDYSEFGIGLGILFGTGALMVDPIKIFLKRRLGIAAGRSWFPFDQIDWIIGTLLFVAPVVSFDVWFIGIALLTALLLSLFFKWVGYRVHLNERSI